jgi:hypothetical protein
MARASRSPELHQRCELLDPPLKCVVGIPSYFRHWAISRSLQPCLQQYTKINGDDPFAVSETAHHPEHDGAKILAAYPLVMA